MTAIGRERVLLIIPCYNEAESIGRLLDDVKRYAPDYDALVIDDGSADATAAIARTKTQCVRLVANLGIGGAVQTGIKYALRHDYDFCVQVDGDGQHPPDQIALLIAHARSSGADMVIGSRFLGDSDGFQSSYLRRLGIRLIRACLRILYKLEITDPTSGFRCLNRRSISLFAGEYPQDYPEPICLALAAEVEHVMAEVPVRMKERQTGSSSIGGFDNLIYMFRVIGSLGLIRLSRLLR